MTERTDLAIEAADVHRAADRIRGVAVRTPLLEYAPLTERIGRRTLVKFEGAQHTGSFKFRGAYNRLVQLSEAQRLAGVVAWSSGNHAQGVAAAARMLGISATIVMPSDAPAVKVENTRALGAEIVPYDRYTQSREDIAHALASSRGAVLVPSFDDPDIIAGQGVVGLEIIDQAAALGVEVGDVLVCCGGGGLVAGVATAIKHAKPSARIYSVEPEAFDDTARSLASGHRERVDPTARSICDALLAPSPGELTFPINLRLLSGGFRVSDEQVLAAMRFAFQSLKLVVEPGGAVALAAALNGAAGHGDGAIVVVVSGANVDPELYRAMLEKVA